MTSATRMIPWCVSPLKLRLAEKVAGELRAAGVYAKVAVRKVAPHWSDEPGEVYAKVYVLRAGEAC